MRGADLLVQSLVAAGVSRIFSLSGNQIMPIYDACIDAGIHIVHTRHESAAVFMADAWAQLTGQVGVALVTAGPGFANSLGALFSALSAESPVLLLSGDAPLATRQHGAFQALDQVSLSRVLCKRAWCCESAAKLAQDVTNAISLACSDRPGPVHLALPFDVLNSRELESADEAGKGATQVATDSRTCAVQNDCANDAELMQIETALLRAKQPVVLTGPALNASRAPQLVAGLEAQYGVPVIAMESPRGLNDPAHGKFASCIKQADWILSLGKQIDFTLGLGAPIHFDHACQWLVVDAQPSALAMARSNLGDRLQAAIQASPTATATALLAHNRPQENVTTNWFERLKRALADRSGAHAEDVIEAKLSPAAICSAVQQTLNAAADAVLVSDGGEFGQWAQACVQAPRRIINGPSGAIGGGLCYALAAAQARPEALVVALMGDGTAGFHLAEFETAVREHTAFVVVIGNDQCWNAEHQIQLREYGPQRLSGCQLSAARYDLAVAGLGGHGEYVTQPDQLAPALQRAVDSGVVACVNVQMYGLPAPSS